MHVFVLCVPLYLLTNGSLFLSECCVPLYLLTNGSLFLSECCVAKEMVSVYRHMTDKEAGDLLEHSILPDTQPYQTIVVGEEGYEYCVLKANTKLSRESRVRFC